MIQVVETRVFILKVIIIHVDDSRWLEILNLFLEFWSLVLDFVFIKKMLRQTVSKLPEQAHR